MDFRKLARMMPDVAAQSNDTTVPNLTDLPPNILEAIIPGYSIISRYASAYLGFDISVFVSIGILLLALIKGGQWLSGQIAWAFNYACMSSVYIDEHDDLFDMVMAWLAEHQTSTSRSRKMRAKTQRGSRADDAFDEVADDALDENGMFSWSKWQARTPPRFEPYYGRQFVWHNGQIFWFKRSRRPNEGQRVQVSFGGAAEDDIIELDCIGRDIAPVKDLLRTIRVWSLNRTTGTTTIRHPTPKDRARFGGTWSKTSSRPSRPMDTVILDNEQKSMIIHDMNEYLHPASPRWYATRGIPYRRGYLFHGPPGTGKTSLSFALAGIFGLEIYAISLQEPTLTEGDLMQLFNGLPRRCIVLLEDVDAAGLVRDGTSEDKDSESKSEKKEEKDAEKKKPEMNGEKKEREGEVVKKDEDFTLKDLARELKAVAAPQPGNRGGKAKRGNASTADGQTSNTGISLSGLLNAIDGVATHEGRVLIMTTNHPEQLDAALVRPGRVDRKVGFKLAMREQVRELFVRMYAASEESYVRAASRPKKKTIDAGLANGHTSGDGSRPSKSVGPVTDDQLASMSREDLETLASDFAERVPESTFTPAEVQNLLMMHKKEPKTAFEKVTSWVEDELRVKEKKPAASTEEKKKDEEAKAGAQINGE
ncbi:hypothetical protein LTR86_003540 [Recurvomyces mirabilis]|nr:hypothetical protein LTR86_003540 [Recurvomyces mirabilis]